MLVGLLLWEFLVRVLQPNPLTIVAPTVILRTLRELGASGELWPHLTASMTALAIGYVACAVVAIPLGLVLGTFDRMYKYSAPWISALYATPIIALAPVVIINFGFGVTSKVVVVALSALFPILINTIAGARTVQGDMRDVGTVFMASRSETFRLIVAPGALTFILTGLKLAVGRALIGVVVADLFGASQGLGLMLLEAAQAFDTARLYVVVTILAVLGVGLTSFVAVFERRFQLRVDRART